MKNTRVERVQAGLGMAVSWEDLFQKLYPKLSGHDIKDVVSIKIEAGGYELIKVVE